MPEQQELGWYRFFRNHENDIALHRDGSGRYRLKTTLFVGKGLSLYSSGECSALEVVARNPGCGVAFIPQSALDAEKLKPLPEFDDGGPGHYEVDGTVNEKKAKRIRQQARIVIQIVGIHVVDGPGG